jgi:thiosulfate reductase cytochrome b subunit
MKEKVLIYTRFERLWHWSQAALIILLGITGFEIHGTFHCCSFEKAVDIHNFCAWSLIVLIAFAIFWHFTTGEWKQYIPDEKSKTWEMVKYYAGGIFRGEVCPAEKTKCIKLNPLQKVTYFLLKIFIFPLQIITGLLYYFYNSWEGWGIHADLGLIALLHTAGAFAFLIFLIVHVYLATTGATPLTHLSAMVTGMEEVKVIS